MSPIQFKVYHPGMFKGVWGMFGGDTSLLPDLRKTRRNHTVCKRFC
jgi:hypothetical protein